jgi:hypothetical protein
MVGGTDVRYSLGRSDDKAHPLLGRRLPAVSAIAEREPELASAWASGRAVLLDLGDDSASRFDIGGWADRVTLVSTKPLPGVEAEAMLLRPDGRVAWVTSTGEDGAGPQQALETWLGGRDGLRQGRL